MRIISKQHGSATLPSWRHWRGYFALCVLTVSAVSHAQWSSNPSGIHYNGGNVGIGTSTPNYLLHLLTSSGDRALYSRHAKMSGFSVGVFGESLSTQGFGVAGVVTATTGLTHGVYGQNASTGGRGVTGLSLASSGFSYGVYGESASSQGAGVFGVVTAASGINQGVYGQAASVNGRGVYGHALATTGLNYGVFGRTESADGVGVGGWAASTTGANYGVYGSSDSPSGTGVYGAHTATTGTTPGVHGATNSVSDSAVGVLGEVTSTAPGVSSAAVRGRNAGTGGNGIGVWGSHDGSGWGVLGSSVSGIGVYGYATAASGFTYGGWFESVSTSGTGVYGYAPAASGFTYGVYGRSGSTSGIGVYGYATATSGTTYGVYGQSDSPAGRGVYGLATATSGATYGVYGVSNSPAGTGVYGVAPATSGAAWGVHGQSDSSASTARGVLGSEPSGGAGHAVYAEGTLAATGTKSFQIDHPLRPETHYLNHFCTEAPEPLNAYSGNITTDAQGYAVVQLPDYFEAINRDFRYQLTVMDSSDDFVLAKVARKIHNNQFVIRTSKPFVEVSWRVEAVRNDRWVQEYGYQTEQEKEDAIKGKYLNPELYGQPKEQGIHYRPEPERPTEVHKP